MRYIGFSIVLSCGEVQERFSCENLFALTFVKEISIQILVTWCGFFSKVSKVSILYGFYIPQKLIRWVFLSATLPPPYTPTNPINFLQQFFLCSFFFLKAFIYLFLERGREGQREGKKHLCVREISISYLLQAPNGVGGTWPITPACAH